MQTMLRTGVVVVGNRWSANPSPRNDLPSVQYLPGGSLIAFKTRRRSILRMRVDRSRTSSSGRFHRLTARAEQSSGVDEVVKEVASDDAVEGPGIADREAKVKADELKPADPKGTATEILHQVQAEEDESSAVTAEGDVGLDVLSSAPTKHPQSASKFFKDVEVDAQAAAGRVGQSIEDAAVAVEDKAGDLKEKGGNDTGSLNEDTFRGETTNATVSEGQITREQAQQKLVETAKDGYEVFKWAAEGVVSAGLNARQGLGVAKEVVDKRLKSFGIAADDTKEVSSQVAEVAQKKFGMLQDSASKFGEEFQVNLEEKKAADSLKPESEANPLIKLGQEFQENLTKATSEDGPLAKLSETLSENLSKVSQAGQEFASEASKTGGDITDKSKENAAEVSSKIDTAKDNFTSNFGKSQKQSGDVTGDLKTEYEDERGNEQLQGQIKGVEGKAPLKYEVDESEPVPSNKQEKSDIGPDE